MPTDMEIRIRKAKEADLWTENYCEIRCGCGYVGKAGAIRYDKMEDTDYNEALTVCPKCRSA